MRHVWWKAVTRLGHFLAVFAELSRYSPWRPAAMMTMERTKLTAVVVLVALSCFSSAAMAALCDSCKCSSDGGMVFVVCQCGGNSQVPTTRPPPLFSHNSDGKLKLETTFRPPNLFSEHLQMRLLIIWRQFYFKDSTYISLNHFYLHNLDI